MSTNKKIIEGFLADEGWSYESEDENIKIEFKAENCFISVSIYESEKSVSIISRLPFTVETEKVNVVSELLHRINASVVNGCFVMDYDYGEIEYQTGISFVNLELSKELFENLFMTNIITADVSAKVIMTVLSTDISPKTAIEEMQQADQKSEKIEADLI